MDPTLPTDTGHIIPVIAGPTASGKSALAMRLAEELGNVEIVSADSRQIYRQLAIGTASPTPEERALVPHHCIDILDITERYSAGQFARDAARAIHEIRAANRLPVVVGGTGFYLKALFDGLNAPPLAQSTLEKLEARIQSEGVIAVYEELQRVDPEAATEIPKENVERVIRALGCYHDTGRPFSSYRGESGGGAAGLVPWYVVVEPTVEETWRRIEGRTTKMLQSGLVEEVQDLLERGYTGSEPGLRTVGYRETIEHLRGETDREELWRKIVVATRRYAKRQRTWFRNQLDDYVLLRSAEGLPERVLEGIRSLERQK